MIRLFVFFLVLGPGASIAQSKIWNCRLKIQDRFIGFRLEGGRNEKGLILRNGKEEIPLDAGEISGDSVSFPISVFDAVLKMPYPLPDSFSGFYRKFDTRIIGYQLSFDAVPGDKEVYQRMNSLIRKGSVSGSYRIEFLQEGEPSDSGMLVMEQEGSRLSGTILTETGDYRFLNGQVDGKSAFLQTFDGGHTYYFSFEFPDTTGRFSGSFLYSAHGKQFIRGNQVKKGFLKDGFSETGSEGKKFRFTAIDSKGDYVTEADPAWNGKAMVVQILGTWCPNCLDETRFLTEEFSKKPPQVEFVGLAFERKSDFDYAFSRIGVVKKKLKAPYPIFWAGLANKDSASATLFQTPVIQAFPTTVFVRKDGTILKVHTGFSGPATGLFFENWKREFRDLMAKLVR